MITHYRFSKLVTVCPLALAAMWMCCAPAGMARGDEAQSKTAAQESGAAPSAFPYKLNVELGKADLAAGDQITILEIRGTAETFQTGQLYWIRGKYTLASHDAANVAAFVTATDSKNAHAPYLAVQTAAALKGDGTFTLFLPMLYRGLPHVSFYGDGGQGFGGVYFGTAGDETPVAKAGSATQSVKFELGKAAFADGDKITITEVRGTSEQFETGGTYVIKGTYKLASHDKAKLAVYVSAADPANGRSSAQPSQHQSIERGEGTFELVLPMNYRGYPHVSFYPGGKGGSGFGEVYFGTGDSVLK